MQPKDLLIEALAQDENMLVHLEEMVTQVVSKMREDQGDQ